MFPAKGLKSFEAPDPGPGREDGAVYAAAVTFELHVPGSRSLKAKRRVIRPVKDVLRNRFRVSVAETDFHDQWQRAKIAVAAVAESRDRLEEILAAVDRYVHGILDAEVLAVDRYDILED